MSIINHKKDEFEQKLQKLQNKSVILFQNISKHICKTSIVQTRTSLTMDKYTHLDFTPFQYLENQK